MTRLPREVLVCYMFVLTFCGIYHLSATSAVSAEKPLGVRKNAATTPLFISCSADKPVVTPNEVIHVRAWTSSPSGEPLLSGLKHVWTVTGGRIAKQGTETRWDFRQVRPGRYHATVRVSGPGVRAAVCSIRVIVEQATHEIEPTPMGRGTGRSLLHPDRNEDKGYGLYSYLLFRSPPIEAARERYLKVIQAYLKVIQPVMKLERFYPPSQLNIAYLPVDAPPPAEQGAKMSAEWGLEHYDFARAGFLLDAIPGDNRDGPYLVSFLKPLSGGSTQPYLYQDLSWVPPHLAEPWVREFMNQAAQERYWEGQTLPQMRLKLRATIGILALGWEDMKKPLGDLLDRSIKLVP